MRVTTRGPLAGISALQCLNFRSEGLDVSENISPKVLHGFFVFFRYEFDVDPRSNVEGGFDGRAETRAVGSY